MAEALVPGGHASLLTAVRTLLHASLLRPEGAPGQRPGSGCSRRSGSTAGSDWSTWVGWVSCAAVTRKPSSPSPNKPSLSYAAPDQVRWLNLLEAELPNIRAALHWAAHSGDADIGLLTAAQLWRFWQVRGRTDEARSYLEPLLASGAGTSGARAAAHLTAARCAFHQGDTPGVQYHVTAALPTLQANADAYSEGFALMILGTATGRAGNADHGLALLHSALDLAKSHRLAWLQSCTLAYLGMVLSSQGRHVQARQALEEGLRGVRELGDSRLIGWFLISLGRSALGAKQPDQARRRFADALSLGTPPRRRLGRSLGPPGTGQRSHPGPRPPHRRRSASPEPHPGTTGT